MQNWCTACSTKVDIKNYKQAVAHYHGSQHKINRAKSQTTPGMVETAILNLTDAEVKAVLDPSIQRPEPPTTIPLKLYADHSGEQYKIYSEHCIVPNVRERKN